jgi:hypothetical protein
MKNKNRINQRIQKKRNKRNTRKKSSPSFEHQIYGYDVDRAEERMISVKDLLEMPNAMNKLQEKTKEEFDEEHKHNLPFNRLVYYYNKSEKGIPTVHLIEKGKNESGFPYVDLGVKPVEIVEDIESPPPVNVTVGDIKEINDLRIKSPNGTLFPYTFFNLKDTYFEGKDLEDKVSIEIRMITNSQYLGLREDYGFTEELLNDAKEMEKYVCNCVRIVYRDSNNESGYVDCPLDDYKRIIMDKDPLRNYENSLPSVRRTLIRNMNDFNYHLNLFQKGEFGNNDVGQIAGHFMIGFFPIMNRHLQNDFREIWNQKNNSKKLERLMVVNSAYQDDLGGIINFRPEELVTTRMEDGWNCLKSHRWEYNEETDDLEFEVNGVEGVSYKHNRKLLKQMGVL